MKKRNFIFGIFSLFVNINFLASESDEQEIPKYKLNFLGDQSVGKSCIMERFVNDNFSKDYQTTNGLEFKSKIVKIEEQDDQKIKFLLYDTAGQEKFRSLIPMYTRDANIILLVYDVTSKNSFLHLPDWLNFLTDNGIDIKDKIFAVVGNKIDFIDTRQVTIEEGENYAKENKFIFKEVSAATGDGINELFDIILKEMLKKKPEGPTTTYPQPEIIKIQESGGKIEPEGGEKDCCCC